MRTWLDASKVYLERRVFVILLLGFSSGLPLLLVYSTLSAWLKESDVSLTMIGLFSWASTAYALKFLWAPVVDSIPLPVLTRLLGQRRSWLVLSQAATMVTMVGLGGTDPATELWWTALWAVLLAFASATQDIVVDAYRIESLDEDQLGAGSANYVFGYRIAMLVAGAGALFIADGYSWYWAYVAMAALMGVGLLTVLLSPEPDREISFVDHDQSLGAQIRDAIINPFVDFMTRPHWIMILLFVALYKYGEALLGVMANPFYLDMGFSKSEIAAVSKGYGFAMTILGGFMGGVLVARYGIMRALWYAGLLQCVANLAFAAQAQVGYSIPMLAVTISIENLTAGMATTAFVAYLSSLCNVAYTATQYALLSSIMSFARTMFASGGGWLADNMDWTSYFILTTFAAVPGLVVLYWLMKRLPIAGPPDGNSVAVQHEER
ncbi:MAG: AmpG family muropeptide MFS transporter [Rhodospirillaceae bacterium]|jgi:MFS transporter, PAT family, beta-lactamase induction signal transducer AmpG|nr:AmpG family muropeptide MFS transporter [Rhodospirillaceae bacterium]MBT4220268.1 AmpG family muropeptide MFS transporter [Rhodospirillaceae bacterium]MBT4463219.1 AmpG family muropeptide MFS transporter [Rhodospirillaceae bacterium]MBT5014573.1 AmpG family muropeptide MFS transporter [Rhodospirillaceae bacterium]MBT5308421.1 AmpG family muropeptide MFS transporter [Rhodospirillaceae bacterium]